MAKILVADDEQLIRKLIGDCLKKEGHTVLEAEDGQKAVELFKRYCNEKKNFFCIIPA